MLAVFANGKQCLEDAPKGKFWTALMECFPERVGLQHWQKRY